MPKAKKRNITVPKNKSLTTTITPSEHLLRQRALRLLVDKGMKITEACRMLKTTPSTIKKFFEDKAFVKELNDRVERIYGIDKDFRVEQSRITLYHLYEELRDREMRRKLKKVKTRQLHKMIIETQKELRLDTPDGFTAKVGVTDLTNLQDRFNTSLSGKLHKIRKTSKTKKKMKKVSRLREDVGGRVNEARESGY